MAFSTTSLDDLISSPETDNVAIAVSELSSPLTHSGRTSPASIDVEVPDVAATTTQKKKKKKKSKKSAKAKEAASQAKLQETESRPPVLCISRNKHWRYISSYHVRIFCRATYTSSTFCQGPWLQLPVELLDSLLSLNLDPAILTVAETRLPLLPPTSSSICASKQRDRCFHGLGDFSPPDSPRSTFSTSPLPTPFPPSKPGKATPPPIDPGVFRSVRSIRQLIDEAAELSVRASSGLSAIELGTMRGGSGLHGSPWATAQSLGLNPLGISNGGGRNVAMSTMRIHRLRALAVQKLAQAYKADEIASSVMVMQGGSVFDDVAERVLKVGTYAKRRCCDTLTYTTQTLTMQMQNTSISSMKKSPLGKC